MTICGFDEMVHRDGDRSATIIKWQSIRHEGVTYSEPQQLADLSEWPTSTPLEREPGSPPAPDLGDAVGSRQGGSTPWWARRRFDESGSLN